MIEAPKCSQCHWCMQKRQAKTNGMNNYGKKYPRKYYWCENPLAKHLPEKTFGGKMPLFISFGKSTLLSPIAIKTSPRWCPLRKADGRGV